MTKKQRKWLEMFSLQNGVFRPYGGKKHLVYKANREVRNLFPSYWEGAAAPHRGETRTLCGTAFWWGNSVDREGRTPWGYRERDIPWEACEDTTDCLRCRSTYEKILILNGEAHKLIVWEV